MDNSKKWELRPSQHEMFVSSALMISYEISVEKNSVKKSNRTLSLPQIITKAIPSFPEIAKLTNVELLEILFGYKQYKNAHVDIDAKRLVRFFRGSEPRSIKIDRASSYIISLVSKGVIKPFEGARLWYISLVFYSAIKTINDFSKNNNWPDSSSFKCKTNSLIVDCCFNFEATLINYHSNACNSIMHKNIENKALLFINHWAYEYWKISNIKRNPLVSINEIIKLSQELEVYDLDQLVNI